MMWGGTVEGEEEREIIEIIGTGDMGESFGKRMESIG